VLVDDGGEPRFGRDRPEPGTADRLHQAAEEAVGFPLDDGGAQIPQQAHAQIVASDFTGSGDR
jgi:hypothetical protein